MRMWKRALTFAVLVFICPNIECKRKKDDAKKSVDCRRTNKSAFRFCTKACKSHNDCKKNERCLCDGDCGMSCVRNNLKCNQLKKTKNLIAKVSDGRSFGSVITYSCPPRYTLRGSSKRSCRAIGEWDGRKTRCRKFCRDPGEITHGNRRYTSFQVGKYITYWCFPGYNMTGNARITCEEDRSTGNPRWSSNKPICQLPTCPRPTIPRNALIDFPRKMPKNFNYNQRVLLKCMYGYVKTSLGILACRGPSWIGGISCRPKSCGSPSEVANGRILGYLYTFKQRVTYACDEGYQIRGPLYRQCQANGKWGGDDPSCDVVNCGPLQRPDHGDIIQQVGTTFGNRIVFDCTGKGYEIRGSKVRTCQSDGSWSGLPTTCELVKCDDPGTPVNGMRIVSKGLVYGGSLRFKCNRDYTLMKGMSEIIYCQANKRWTASVPYCLAPCRDPGAPRQGRRIGDDFRHDSKVIFSCPNDYLMEGVGEIRCSNGTWSNSVPTCKAPCAKLSKPANGYMRGDFRHGSQVRFVCLYGYQRIGAASSTCNDGTWSNSAPICKGICGRPRVSSRVHVHGNSFLDGDEVQFSCVANYDLFGSQRSRCVGQRWNTGIPECKARCVFGGDPDNGFAVRDPFFNRVVNHGVQITYRCNENYTLIGSATQECNNGHWTNSRPSCKAPCRDPGVPRQGSRIGDDFRHGSKVTFTCRDDYNMEGVREISCSNGAWSNRVPSCKAPCAKLSKPANGYMRGDFRHGSQVRFVCLYGYQRIGAASSTCNDGTWSNSAPICKGICGRPRVSSRVHVHGNSFLDGDEVQFSCVANYDLFGSQRSRCVGQRWNTGIPECKASCQWPGRIDNGREVRHSYKHGDTVQYVCNKGYILDGKRDLTCVDGAWSSRRPACRASCRRPEPPRNGGMRGDNFNHNEKVVFYCDENYQLVGESEITCKDGSWSDSYPTCVAACDHPGDIEHGQLTSQYFSHGQLVRYKCDLGYSLEGNHELTCNNGDWNSNLPNCKACQNPIGMENPSIRNIRITSADYLSSPTLARLNGRFAWCTTKQTYLQVNLGKRHQLTTIATQGGQDNTGIISWVRKYKLSFFAGPRKEIFYQESGTQQVIDGNQNASSTVTYFFKEPFITQVVRIYPNFNPTPVCLRMELYGCDPNPDCIHVGSVVYGLWERKGDSLNYYVVYITQLNATHVDFVLDYTHGNGILLTRSYNRSEPVLVVDEIPKMIDILVGSRVIGVHKRAHKEWYQAGTVIRTTPRYAYVRFGSGTDRWVPPRELRLQRRPRFCATGA
ncbi:CUB and sushi domain-containing protein 3-like isoform X3 [Acropora palmata]|uniref:CUB and sushi domain-containing protein 3-like isoform X3 n=1 Tax=Acropora palmata TaxID=6131 RepID=UPI003DA0DC6D